MKTTSSRSWKVQCAALGLVSVGAPSTRRVRCQRRVCAIESHQTCTSDHLQIRRKARLSTGSTLFLVAPKNENAHSRTTEDRSKMPEHDPCQDMACGPHTVPSLGNHDWPLSAPAEHRHILYRSLAKYRVKTVWEKYLEIPERSYVFPRQIMDPSGSIFSKASVVTRGRQRKHRNNHRSARPWRLIKVTCLKAY
jgi:hypothetical protein